MCRVQPTRSLHSSPYFYLQSSAHKESPLLPLFLSAEFMSSAHKESPLLPLCLVVSMSSAHKESPLLPLFLVVSMSSAHKESPLLPLFLVVSMSSAHKESPLLPLFLSAEFSPQGVSTPPPISICRVQPTRSLHSSLCFYLQSSAAGEGPLLLQKNKSRSQAPPQGAPCHKYYA